MRRLERWYVDISHLDNDDLEFFGWYLIHEEDEFAIYERPYAEEFQLVHKAKPFLIVDDINDAHQMKGMIIIQAPPADLPH